MLQRILSPADEQLLADERQWLSRLQIALARFDASREDLAILERSVRQLDQFFFLIVVGEFNSGKSAFINALIGRKVLDEGVTPTTTRIQVLKHGPEGAPVATETSVDVITAPVDLLREINIVDTPGTNAIFREHEVITNEFVPRADLVLFVTSADRPFTESERSFLEGIREWGKKVVVIINKVDILDSVDDIARVERFVAGNAASLLGATPEVFSVSSRVAFRAKTGAPAAGIPGDRFVELERFLASTLDQRERVRLKLLNPLGIGMRLLDQYLKIIGARLDLLVEDVVTVNDIEAQLNVYGEDLRRDFRYRLSHIDNVLYEFERRGTEFFEDTLRIGRLFDLLKKSRLKSDFERRVVADAPDVIERHVQELIDWIVASDLRQWQGITERLQRRRTLHADRLIGEVGGTFHYDRARLLDTVGRAAERVIESYDKEHEANEMAESVRAAVAGTALAEVGAVGLGAVVTALASTTFADVTGILAAGTVAVLGLLVIPIRRQQAKRELRTKIVEMRRQLMQSLTMQFDRELAQSAGRVADGIAPYTRFVRGERERLTGLGDELRSIQGSLGALRAAIERL